MAITEYIENLENIIEQSKAPLRNYDPEHHRGSDLERLTNIVSDVSNLIKQMKSDPYGPGRSQLVASVCQSAKQQQLAAVKRRTDVEQILNRIVANLDQIKRELPTGRVVSRLYQSQMISTDVLSTAVTRFQNEMAKEEYQKYPMSRDGNFSTFKNMSDAILSAINGDSNAVLAAIQTVNLAQMQMDLSPTDPIKTTLHQVSTKLDSLLRERIDKEVNNNYSKYGLGGKK
jgi:hypothetical protein